MIHRTLDELLRRVTHIENSLHGLRQEGLLTEPDPPAKDAIDLTLTGEQIDDIVRKELQRCIDAIEEDVRRGWEDENAGEVLMEALNIVLGMYGG